MAEHDVPYVLGPEAEGGDLVQRGFGEVQDRLGAAEEVRTEVLLGARYIRRADAALDQDEAVAVGFDEQAVADGGQAPLLAVDRPQGAAVQVVDLHDESLQAPVDAPGHRRRAVRPSIDNERS